MQNLGVTGFRVSHRVGMEGPPELGGVGCQGAERPLDSQVTSQDADVTGKDRS